MTGTFNPVERKHTVGVFSKSESEREEPVGRGDVKPASPEIISTLGHGVLVTGNIVSESTLQICGRVNGDIHAAHLVIQEGAQIEGNVVSQETIILGICKGIIRGNSVKLQGNAVVEGEIYSKSLTIEHEAQFEGVSRRLDKPVDAPLRAQATMPATIPLAPSMTEAGQSGAVADKIDA
jgi:cytoskeletal protein CcmA (bactofilin family)